MNANLPTNGTAAAQALPSLVARQLAVGYDETVVVSAMNLTIQRGQSLALIGPNGSGKSTLLRTIVGLQPPLGGEIQVLGKTPSAATRQIGYLGQMHASGIVLPLRAVDVVRMGRFPAHGLLGRMTRQDEEWVDSAMRTMEVAQLADLPLRALSGGQQQRVYLAQVLAHRADLLVLDEPMAGLDVAGREVYLQAIRSELARNAAVIVATHDLQEAAACDWVMLLAGRVVAYGPSRSVLTPTAMLEAFGIVLTSLDGKLAMAVAEREHGYEHQGTRER
jgi:ABC-type Mn2+/Zn2+ transport system ATPase subunit